jgi:hypothetical protein
LEIGGIGVEKGLLLVVGRALREGSLQLRRVVVGWVTKGERDWNDGGVAGQEGSVRSKLQRPTTTKKARMGRDGVMSDE